MNKIIYKKRAQRVRKKLKAVNSKRFRLSVYRSTQTSSKPMMKYFLWSSWILLASLIFNEKMGVFEIPEYVMTISAITLAVLHIYNLKYCQCDDERCCNN